MKHLFLCINIFAILLTSQSSVANESPQAAIQAPLAKQKLLLDIVQTSNGKFIAVGERGHILLSNSGQEWQQVEVPTQATLVAVDFVDDNVGYVVGHDNTILKTQDGGNTWTLQNFDPAAEKPFLDVLFFDANHGITIGAYGQFYRTKDGGVTWVREDHIEVLPEEDVEYLAEVKEEDLELYHEELGSILPHFNRLKLVGDVLYMVGEVGLIARSTDLGLHWQLLEEIYPGSFFDIAAVDDVLVVGGLRGHVFRSEDNGANWSEVETGVTSSINSIEVSSDGSLYVFMNNGNMLASTDKGKSFENHPFTDGKAVINGKAQNDELVLVTEVGVKTVTLK